MENKSRRKNKKSRNGTVNDDDGEPDVLVVPSSSSDSIPVEEKEDADEAVEEVNDNDDDEEEIVVEDDDNERDEVETDAAAKSTKREGSNKKKNKNKEKNSKENCNGASTESSSSLYRFPMHRVNRIIKSEDPNIRISQEAVFVINKASEKFLQLFSMEAYACAFLDRKKCVAYHHLSSVVTKRRRFDFLSDFVPVKLKAEDALKEMPSVDTS